MGKEEEEPKMKKGGGKMKWANHYSSLHEILLVGEGDFSFSLSLANAFGSASNMVSTSLDSYDTLLKKYNEAQSNLESLKKLGATVLHEVDATRMKVHQYLKMRRFDRIVFNFPHAGFIGREDKVMVIGQHRQLVNDFFRNAIHMLRPHAEIHVSHKTGDPFDKWNLEELASENSLILTGRARFRTEDYPGYNNKRGDWPRSDEPFPLGECSTFKFRIQETRKRKRVSSESSFPEIASPNLGYPCIGFQHESFSITLVGRSERDACIFFDACQAYRNTGNYPCQARANEMQGRTVSGELGYSKMIYNRSLISRYGVNADTMQETAVSGDSTRHGEPNSVFRANEMQGRTVSGELGYSKMIYNQSLISRYGVNADTMQETAVSGDLTRHGEPNSVFPVHNFGGGSYQA